MSNTSRNKNYKYRPQGQSKSDSSQIHFESPPPERTLEEIKLDKAYWSGKVIGKKLCDGPATDDKVHGLIHHGMATYNMLTPQYTFSKDNLPSLNRIYGTDGIYSCDWITSRVNIEMDEEGTVERVWVD